jgi:hypothetical protein
MDPSPFICPDGSLTCVRVDVFRGAQDRFGVVRGTALPIFFGTFVGRTSQHMRATATAQTVAGNASNCLKPWIIPDIWYEDGVADRSGFPDTYDKWVPCGGGTMCESADDDEYVAPAGGSPRSGFNTALDVGRQVTIKAGDPTTISDSVYFRWDVPRVDGIEDVSDNEQYRANISGSCNGTVVKIGDILNDPSCSGYNCLRTLDGSTDGPTWQETKELIDADFGAYWDTSCNCVKGSTFGGKSPRIVTVPVFDTEHRGVLHRELHDRPHAGHRSLHGNRGVARGVEPGLLQLVVPEDH